MLEGLYKSTLFRNESNDYSVIRIEEKETAKSVTVTGFFPEFHEGDQLVFRGEWKEHAKFGKQFHCAEFEQVEPETKEGLIGFLGSGMIKGVGLGMASRIVDHFGEETLRILDEDPGRVREVRGFGTNLGNKFVEQWQEQRQLRTVLMQLQKFNVPQSLGMRLFRKYGSGTTEELTTNPYILCNDPFLQGFEKADELAKKMGFDLASPKRFQAFYKHLLRRGALEGHTYLNRDILLGQAFYKFKNDCEPNALDRELELCLDHLIEEGFLVQLEDRISLPWYAKAEREIADWVQGAVQKNGKIKEREILEGISDFERETDFELSEAQKEAIKGALLNPLFVITGGPGTGKTTTLKGLLFLIRRTFEKKVSLCAPTGRAAKRMGEVTNFEAQTIHRLLDYRSPEEGFAINSESQLKVDFLVLDETSMVDCLLMQAVVRSLQPHTHLILIGDKDQLPPVGPGLVFREILESNRVPKVALDRIYRQGEGSDIPENSHRINQGEMPEFKRKTNFHLRSYGNREEGLNKIVDLVAKDLPEYFRIDPLEDIQILCPMHKGELGTEIINQMIRDRLNPHGKVIQGGKREFRVGDKVMQLRNNYDRDIFNGDIGKIISFDKDERTLKVEFDRVVELEFSELDQLTLAYACSIHKSQGNEYPFVVVVLDSSHHVMLQRNLLYTAVTRARERVFLVSSLGVISHCVGNNKEKARNTLLGEYLKVREEFLDLLEG